jgi:hypothetical protein
MPVERYGHIAVVLNNTMFIAQGSGTSSRDDILSTSNGVDVITVNGSSILQQPNAAVSVLNDLIVYISGGSNSRAKRNIVYRTSDSFRTVTAAALIPGLGLYYHVSLIYADRLHLVTGYNSSGLFNLWHYSYPILPNGNLGTVSAVNVPSELGRRWAAGVVFQNQMLVIGGLVSTGNSNDVWSCTASDGSAWTQLTAAAAFALRHGHTLTVYNNALLMIGGQADVSLSTDAVTWIRLTASAPFVSRRYHSAVVWGNAVVIAGGLVSTGIILNEIWAITIDVPLTTCSCAAGWIGVNCTINIDECSSSPCLNGATCIDGIASYQCQCVVGWFGANCNSSVDYCLSSPCANGGICATESTSYQCACAAGYGGVNCTVDINECIDGPCGNGGTCLDGIASYQCSCVSGYAGQNCTSNIDDCAGSPCRNGGTCVDGVNRYACQCAVGYADVNCSMNLDDCVGRPCSNGGTCVDGVNSYLCRCVQGYVGVNCTVNVNECQPNPCRNGGTCLDGIASYVCNCSSAYTGINCTGIIPVVYVPPPPPPVIAASLTAVISAPSDIGNCDTLLLDAGASYATGAAATVPILYNWTLTSMVDATTYIPIAVTDVIIGSTMGSYVAGTRSIVSIAAFELPANTVFTFTVTLRNSLNHVSLPVNAVIRKGSLPVPIAVIAQPVAVTRAALTILQPSITVTQCNGTSSAPLYAYRWQQLFGVTLPISITSSAAMFQRSLVLPAYSLSAGSSYVFMLSIIDVNSSVVLTQPQVTFGVAVSPLVATIVGSDRARSIDQANSIDATQSSDPDLAPGQATAFTFTWQCQRRSSTVNAQPVEASYGTLCTQCAICGAAATTAILTLPIYTLSAGYDYMFRVQLAAGTARAINSRSITIRALEVPVYPNPLINIQASAAVINTASTFRVQSTITSTSATPVASLTCLWVESNGRLNLPALFTAGQLLTSPTSPNLVIAANTLTAGVDYVFLLTVSDPNRPEATTAALNIVQAVNDGGVATASITVSVALPPSAGTFSVTPLIGDAYSTTFAVN